jgi:hypothetical protein
MFLGGGAGGDEDVPEFEVAAPATAAPPTAAPLRAATPNAIVLTLPIMVFLSLDRGRPGLGNHDAAALLGAPSASLGSC